jgi:glutathione peroxidase
MDSNSIYRFTVEKLDGDHINLADYSNKVLLIVNIASQCGFTPQLQELADLKKEFADKDFEILAFPSNDFGGQEPLKVMTLQPFAVTTATTFPFSKKHG